MIRKAAIEDQIFVIKKIIESIKDGKYYNACTLILYDLNDSSYVWYKDIQHIIENQLQHLFLDIEEDFKNNYSIDFWERQITKLEGMLKHPELYEVE